ncbi:MAG: thrombospondin type 3 repeat-containing protein [bacterium]|nr:thrombospondin type 3 repeat-containing protein [bacterium]
MYNGKFVEPIETKPQVQNNIVNNLNSNTSQPHASGVEISKPFNKATLIGVIFVFLLFAGGGVLAVIYFGSTPESIINKMILKMKDVKSFEFDGYIVLNTKTNDITDKDNISIGGIVPIDFSTLENKVFSVRFNFAGKNDINDPEYIKSQFKFETDDKSKSLLPVNIGTELRSTGDDFFYLKLTKLVFPDAHDTSKSLDTLVDKWVQFDIKSVRESGLAFMSNTNSDINKIWTDNVSAFALDLPNLFTDIKKLNSEKINNIDSYHFSFVINKEVLKRMYSNYDAKKLDLFGDAEFTDFMRKQHEDNVGNFGKLIDEKFISMRGEVWIDRKEYNLTKIELYLAGEDKRASGEVTISVQVFNHNMPIGIEKPIGATTVDVIMSELIMSLVGGKEQTLDIIPNSFDLDIDEAELNVLDTTDSDDSDSDGLSDLEEEILGTDPNNSDTDGDGFSDYDEISNGYNPNGDGFFDPELIKAVF